MSNTPNLYIPVWTPSYQLYGQPHAIWLDQYDRVGANLEVLEAVLEGAAQAQKVPELVIYAIPLRDLGQSSEGGFTHMADYLADNRQNAERIRLFVENTGLHPVIYLEPDSIPLAVQYRRDNQFNEESRRIYAERIRVTNTLIHLYQKAGGKVYLEAGHSGWFDYGDEDIQRIADALNEAGIGKADGLATNVSNRQPVLAAPPEHHEFHYLSRLLPLLDNKHLDVRVDTSRNGGKTTARQYYLAPNGQLIDNETPSGRLVGSWQKDETATFRITPFFGKPKAFNRLITKEKYTWNAEKRILIAPPWLDAVGDVQPGPAPTDTPPAAVASVIQHFRYIKPPDDCDGALNCPPGASKHEINEQTAQRQPTSLSVPPDLWK